MEEQKVNSVRRVKTHAHIKYGLCTVSTSIVTTGYRIKKIELLQPKLNKMYKSFQNYVFASKEDFKIQVSTILDRCARFREKTLVRRLLVSDPSFYSSETHDSKI